MSSKNSTLSGQFKDLSQKERTAENVATIGQIYTSLRTIVIDWDDAVKNAPTRIQKKRLFLTSKIIWENLISNIDEFINSRLENISKLENLDALDKDSLKNLR